MARRSPRAPDPRLIDTRNRVSLPGDVLRALDAAAGDYVTFVLEPDGTIHVHKVSMTLSPARPPG